MTSDTMRSVVVGIRSFHKVYDTINRNGRTFFSIKGNIPSFTTPITAGNSHVAANNYFQGCIAFFLLEAAQLYQTIVFTIVNFIPCTFFPIGLVINLFLHIEGSVYYTQVFRTETHAVDIIEGQH